MTRQALTCFLALCLLTLVRPAAAAPTSEGCEACHEGTAQQLPRHHRFATGTCSSCHGGNPVAATPDEAHSALVRRPGELDNAPRACGGCHPKQLQGVLRSPMHRGERMVRTTREVIGAGDDPAAPAALQALGDGIADSLLRKLCASCHLGQPGSPDGTDPALRRGGGCLACHLAEGAAGRHPALSAAVGDASCFGCHSRSGRISLNYAGLGETEPGTDASQPFVLLGDGRPVVVRDPDVHHRAGMSCIDCHTGRGLMGQLTDPGIDIACDDCHANTQPRVTPDTWPADQAGARKRVPFDAAPGQRFLTTARGTPLWQIEVRSDGLLLHPKTGGAPLTIPQIDRPHPAGDHDHASLACDACHATWAPQCYGCHLDFDPGKAQWDHAAKRPTPGAWSERRWDLRNAAPPLGWRADGRVGVFVPGMIMTMSHPGRSADLFVRRFAPLSPHTSGAARTCEDCHRSPLALGLGEGRVQMLDDRMTFHPAGTTLRDGLPADAWTSLEPQPARPDLPRPFAPDEIRRLLQIPLPEN